MQGYGITHSAFGYGNETVLCNDPHPTPWSNLDDAEVNQEASDKGNVRVRICRIGPWVFPIQITTSFLPKGWCECCLWHHVYLIMYNIQEKDWCCLPRLYTFGDILPHITVYTSQKLSSPERI